MVRLGVECIFLLHLFKLESPALEDCRWHAADEALMYRQPQQRHQRRPVGDHWTPCRLQGCSEGRLGLVSGHSSGLQDPHSSAVQRQTPGRRTGQETLETSPQGGLGRGQSERPHWRTMQ